MNIIQHKNANLIGEWLARHPDTRALKANFSLFGGEVDNFASQLSELPQDRLDEDMLLQGVLKRVKGDQIGVLVLDDIHWAGSDGLAFVSCLASAMRSAGVFVILSSRPSGRHLIQALQPAATIELQPLSSSNATALARQLNDSSAVTAEAVTRANGNPLFVEQFVAWAAEAGFQGGPSGPRTLHQVIAARIKHLHDVVVKDIQQRLRWGGSWQREIIDRDLSRLEADVGLWLDRLETGDFADRVEAARHLGGLERLDYEIFITSMLAGRPRPRSSRLREAIERLFVGSADQILADLKRRASERDSDKDQMAREAEHAGSVVADAYDWGRAVQFYALACATSQGSDSLQSRLQECERHASENSTDEKAVSRNLDSRDFDADPSVDALDLPYAWIRLGRLHSCQCYFARAVDAAQAINDHALANWARNEGMKATHRAMRTS